MISLRFCYAESVDCCFHISFSFSAAYKAPLCKGGWQKSLISDWGIVLCRYLTIPPSRLAPCHLPQGGRQDTAISKAGRQEFPPSRLTPCHRLAAARSRSGSDTTPWCHSLPSRRSATRRRRLWFVRRFNFVRSRISEWHILEICCRWRKIW